MVRSREGEGKLREQMRVVSRGWVGGGQGSSLSH